MSRLHAGTLAPDFSAENWNGETVSLSAFRGNKLWLAFFRYASCPLCNLRVHQMIERHSALTGAGLSIVAVFQSPPDSVKRYVGKQEPPFPLVCDPDEALYREFGLEASLPGFLHPANAPKLAAAAQQGFLPGAMEGTKTRLPADFLIDEEGVIREAVYAEAIGEHIPFERVGEFLELAKPA